MKIGDKVRIKCLKGEGFYPEDLKEKYIKENGVCTVSYVTPLGFEFDANNSGYNFFCSFENDADFEYELVDEEFDKQMDAVSEVAKTITLNTDELVAQLKEITEKNDKVNHPSHYQTAGGIEVIEYIASLLGDNVKYYYLGNVIKYMSRFDKKNGVEDLEKARFYLNKMIEMENK